MERAARQPAHHGGGLGKAFIHFGENILADFRRALQQLSGLGPTRAQIEWERALEHEARRFAAQDAELRHRFEQMQEEARRRREDEEEQRRSRGGSVMPVLLMELAFDHAAIEAKRPAVQTSADIHDDDTDCADTLDWANPFWESPIEDFGNGSEFDDGFNATGSSFLSPNL